MTKRSSIKIFALCVAIGTAASILIIRFAGKKESGPRHDWKVAAIADIERITSDKTAIAQELDPIRRELNGSQHRFDAWVSPTAAIMANGDWLIFQNRYTHRYPEIGDIWIAKASNGKWYYSTYHFCSGMVSLQSDLQPANLDEFIAGYFVRPFDGKADYVLEETWNSSMGQLR